MYFAVLVAVDTATVLQYYYLMSIIADVCIYLLIINENTILLFYFELLNLSCLLICICDDTFFKSYVVMYLIFVIIDYYDCAAV